MVEFDVPMFDELKDAIERARKSVLLVEQSNPSAAESARLVTLFAELERLATAGRVLAVGRAVKTGAWHGTAHRTPAEWVATTMQTSMKQAVESVQTAARLESLPATRAALVDGRLSDAQVVAVAAAAGEVPAAEADLLRVAKRESVRGLRLECARVVSAGPGDADRYERIRRTRSVRHWIEPDGAFQLQARLTPDVGARIVAAIREEQAKIFDREQRAGRREPRVAYAADALAQLVLNREDGRTKGAGATMRIFCDLAALRRGHVERGETCEIAGFGPVSIAAARQLLGHSLLELVLTRGRDITTIARVGRPVPALVRRAVEARDRKCIVQGCDETEGLELDHHIPIWAGGSSSVENCGLICAFEHYLKTYHGYTLEGPPGGPMKLVPPSRRSGTPEARGDPASA